MVVNYIKIYQKMNNKSLLSIKNIIKWEKPLIIIIRNNIIA